MTQAEALKQAIVETQTTMTAPDEIDQAFNEAYLKHLGADNESHKRD